MKRTTLGIVTLTIAAGIGCHTNSRQAQREALGVPVVIYREPSIRKTNGITWDRYLGSFDALPDLDNENSHATGTATTIGLGHGEPANNYAYRFTGYIDVPRDGTYTFFTATDDTKLFIGSTVVLDKTDMYDEKEKSGAIDLTAGRHAIKVFFYGRGDGTVLSVSWSGPGSAKQPIPAHALYRVGSK